MVEKLKESENKLESMLAEKEPDNIEVPAEEADETSTQDKPPLVKIENDNTPEKISNPEKSTNKNSDVNTTLKKVTNIENEQLNKTLQNTKVEENPQEHKINEPSMSDNIIRSSEHMEKIDEKNEDVEGDLIEIKEIQSNSTEDTQKNDQHLNEVLRKNILSCVEKVARIEEMKTKTRDSSSTEDQVSVC